MISDFFYAAFARAILRRRVALDARAARPPLGRAHPVGRPPQSGGGEAAEQRECHERPEARDRSGARPATPSAASRSLIAPRPASDMRKRVPPTRRAVSYALSAAPSSNAKVSTFACSREVPNTRFSA